MKLSFKLLVCLFCIVSIMPSLAQVSIPERVEKPDQLKENLDKLDQQIQELNTSLDSGTEEIKRKQFEESIRQYRDGLPAHKKRLEKEQRSQNRRSLFRIIGIITVIVIAIANRGNRKKVAKDMNDALESAQSQIDKSKDQSE